MLISPFRMCLQTVEGLFLSPEPKVLSCIMDLVRVNELS